MMDLFNNHTHEIGSELKKQDPIKYKTFESTDCITYSLNVLSFAFNNIGDAKAAKQVWQLGKKGTELAKYLVNTHGWKGVYINPDSNHPIDADPEHTYTSAIASKTCTYYKIPIEYKVHNYTVTPKHHTAFQQLKKILRLLN